MQSQIPVVMGFKYARFEKPFIDTLPGGVDDVKQYVCEYLGPLQYKGQFGVVKDFHGKNCVSFLFLKQVLNH